MTLRIISKVFLRIGNRIDIKVDSWIRQNFEHISTKLRLESMS